MTKRALEKLRKENADDLIECQRCDWAGNKNDLIDLFCPNCGNYVEKRR